MLHVETVGLGTPVVLLHSSGLSSRQFTRLGAAIAAQGKQAVLVDLTGHGKSPPLPEGEPMTWRDDVARVVELLRVPSVLVGHSYGGLVALHAALVAPDRVQGLILYDPVAFGILDEGDRDVAVTLDAIDLHGGATPETRDAWLEAFVDYWSGPGAWGGLRESARAEFRRVGWAVREGVRTLMGDLTKAAAYRALPPLHLITGEHTPVAARRVVDKLAAATGADVSELPGAGHMGPLTHADQFSARVLELLQ
ncbi:MAG: alpha/beta hydrolase [Kofleriaceae bacterium]